MNKKFFNWKVILVLAAISVMAILVALIRPGSQKERGMSEDEYVWRKMNMTGKGDLILAGDSRMANNISPFVLKEILPEVTILNCGFEGQLFSERYFEYVTSCLKPDAKNPVIVLGVSNTNLGMMSLTYADSKFERYDYNSYNSQFLFRVYDMFAALEVPEIKVLLKRKNGLVIYRVFHANGWAEIVVTDNKSHYTWSEKTVGKDCSARFEEGLTFLESWAKKLRQSGITLICFQQPLSTLTQRIASEENYNGDEVIRRLTAAGVVWLSDLPDGNNYISVNDHLESKSAKHFSALLGEKLRAAMVARKLL